MAYVGKRGRPASGTSLWSVLAVATVLLASPLQGQDPELLRSAFEGQALTRIRTEIEGARAEGIPVEPLVLKALEGRSKGADDEVILRAVVALRDRLRRAASLVGREAKVTTLVAAAGALYVGVAPDVILEMHRQMEEGAVEMALVVLGDLVQRGVPVGEASGAILSMGSAGLDAPGFERFRERVDADIRGGLSPLRATEVQVRGVMVRIGGGGGG